MPAKNKTTLIQKLPVIDNSRSHYKNSRVEYTYKMEPPYEYEYSWWNGKTHKGLRYASFITIVRILNLSHGGEFQTTCHIYAAEWKPQHSVYQTVDELTKFFVAKEWEYERDDAYETMARTSDKDLLAKINYKIQKDK